MKDFKNKIRLKRSEKNAEKKQWYKDKLDDIDLLSFNDSLPFSSSGMNTKQKQKLFYKAYNNKISHHDYKMLCDNFSKSVGNFPEEYVLKNIISPKLKSVIGYELKRPLGYSVIAVNKEATTRKEQLETQMLREYVINSIQMPIRKQLELKYAEQAKEMTPTQKEELAQKIEQELQTMTPEEVKYYMEREHQDPAEVLSTHILEYYSEKIDIKAITNIGWKHGILSSLEVYRIMERFGNPHIKNVNPIRFDCEKTYDPTPIQDRQWACEEFFLSIEEFDTIFGDEFSKIELEEIYDEVYNVDSSQQYPRVSDTVRRGQAQLDFTSFDFDEKGSRDKPIRVLHGEWKALKPIYFLTYMEQSTGEVHTSVVDESYEFNPEAGDIHIEEKWIQRTYEGYKIGKEKYAFLQEVEDQILDLDDLDNCKLSYVGNFYDDTNSEATPLIERGISWEYLYNVIWARIEKLIGSDQGKKLILNYNLIPKSKGIDFKQFMEYLDLNDLGLLDPTEEGARGADISNSVKMLDMSLLSDITRYMQLADYIEQRCGEAMGINKQMEGQIKQREAVRNTQQALEQSAVILEPYFDVHAKIQKDLLNMFLNKAISILKRTQPMFLSYVTDDMSKKMLEVDYELLENSVYGVFVSNSSKSYEIRQTMKDLSFAAMQNQAISMADVIKIMNTSSPKEAEERLEAAEKERQQREQAIEQEKLAMQEKMQKQQQDWQVFIMDKEHQQNMEELQLKGDIDLKEQLILSMGFNEDKDMDNDGIPDIMEIAKEGLKANIAADKSALEREKLAQQDKHHKEKMSLEEKKLKQVNNKKTN